MAVRCEFAVTTTSYQTLEGKIENLMEKREEEEEEKTIHFIVDITLLKGITFTLWLPAIINNGFGVALKTAKQIVQNRNLIRTVSYYMFN